MVNFGAMVQQAGFDTQTSIKSGIIQIIENFKYIVAYFYREWHIAYETIMNWKIGTFFWHLTLMIEEVQIRQERTNAHS